MIRVVEIIVKNHIMDLVKIRGGGEILLVQFFFANWKIILFKKYILHILGDFEISSPASRIKV